MKRLGFQSLAAIVLPVLLLPPVSAAQQSRSSTSQTTAAKGADTHAGGTREQIKVHGHWTIEVRNVDGSKAARYEFENSLDASNPLSLVLIGGVTTRYWELQITGSPGICLSSSGAAAACTTNNLPPLATTPGNDLVVTRFPLTFTGSVRAQAAGQIVQVATVLHSCPENYQPGSTCGASERANTFTSRDLSASPIPVSNGQAVVVTVVITFT